jgi:signal transduction histidine kinase/response regulator of citrate/malate metabolism
MVGEAYKKIANQANLKRIFVFAPSMAIYLTTEFIRDIRKLFRASYAHCNFNLGSFSINAYILFVILDGLFVLSSLAIFGFSLFANKKLKNNHWNNFYYQLVKAYGLFLTLCAFIAVLVTARTFGVADFTFAFIIVTLTSAILYINSIVTITVDSLCFILSFVLIKIFDMAGSYNPYWAYIIVFMLISTATAFIKERHLRETLERERMKSMFLANMSHEIRTPMNAIVGMSELAMDFNISDSEKNILRQIRSSGINLVEIINDILDFSKIESGKMEIMPHDYDLVKLMNDIMNVVEVRLKGKPVELILEIDPALAKVYHGDDVRLRQILINLAGNASKFTEKGSIRIRVEDLSKVHESVPHKSSIYDGAQGKEGLRFSVIDTGVGIKKEDIGKLFRAFQQVDMQMNRAKGGTGLGLSISKTLVTLMHGTIGVDSEYGKGSTFYVNLPQERVSEETCGEFYKAIFEAGGTVREGAGDVSSLKQLSLAVLNSPEFAGLFNEKQAVLPFKAPKAKILVVDDNEVNLQVADGLLQKFDIHCTKAMSGYEALDILKTQSFDIIFMDHQMPGMDGVETLEKIREAEKDLPEEEKSLVIVLSANAVNGAREMFLSKGFNDFVAKPVQGKDFAACLSKWLKKDLMVMVDSTKDAEIDVPEDFPVLPQDKLDVKKAVELAGGFENWLTIARTFAGSIAEKAEQIQDYYEKGAIKDYTIQVHALKSASRILGAEKLSELAAGLEEAGNLLQKNEEMLELYRSYGALLEPVKNYGAQEEGEKQELTEKELTEIIEAIRSGCANFDLVEVEEKFALLQKAKLPEKLAGKMEELSKAVENIEFEQVEEILKNF